MISPTAPAERIGPVRRLAKLAQTGLAVAGLGSVTYWGHSTDWTFLPQRAADLERDSLPPPPSVVAAPDGTITITYPTTAAAEAAGIEAAPVWRTEMTDAVAADGEIHFDPNRVTNVSARATGTCVAVRTRVGDLVRPGDVLAVVDAPDVGRAKAEMLFDLVQVRLKRRGLADLTAAGGTVSTRQRTDAESAVRDAELKYRAAEQHLSAFGIAVKFDELIALPAEAAAAKLRTLGHDVPTESSNFLPVRSPAAGVVLDVGTAIGEAVDTIRPLFTVVDPSRVRVTLHVPGPDAEKLAVGQRASFRPDGSTRDFTGTVSGLAQVADPATRTLPVWIDLDNADGRLRPNALGRGTIAVRVAPDAITVPNAAVQTVRGQAVVFLRDREFLKDGWPKSFRLRAVRIGAADSANTEILAGLDAEAVVAAKGSAILLHEALAGRSEPTGGGP